MRLRYVPLDMSFAEAFKVRSPDAYERLILDVIRGNQTLFMRRDEVEAAWAWIDPIAEAWERSREAPKPYPAGTWGPSAAVALIERDGRTWHDDAGSRASPVTFTSSNNRKLRALDRVAGVAKVPDVEDLVAPPFQQDKICGLAGPVAGIRTSAAGRPSTSPAQAASPWPRRSCAGRCPLLSARSFGSWRRVRAAPRRRACRGWRRSRAR